QPFSELEVGQGLTYHRADRSYRLAPVAAADSRSWTEGKITLARATFAELAQNFYNLHCVRLKSSDAQVQAYRYNLTSQSTQRQEDATDLICTILKQSHRKEGNGDLIIY